MAELVYPQKITFFHNKTPPHFDCFNPTIYIARTHSRWNPRKRMVPRFFSMAMVIFGSLRSFFHHGNGEIHLHFHGICLDYQSGNHQKWAYKLNTSLVYKSLKIWVFAWKLSLFWFNVGNMCSIFSMSPILSQALVNQEECWRLWWSGSKWR